LQVKRRVRKEVEIAALMYANGGTTMSLEVVGANAQSAPALDAE